VVLEVGNIGVILGRTGRSRPPFFGLGGRTPTL